MMQAKRLGLSNVVILTAMLFFSAKKTGDDSCRPDYVGQLFCRQSLRLAILHGGGILAYASVLLISGILTGVCTGLIVHRLLRYERWLRSI